MTFHVAIKLTPGDLDEQIYEINIWNKCMY